MIGEDPIRFTDEDIDTLFRLMRKVASNQHYDKASSIQKVRDWMLKRKAEYRIDDIEEMASEPENRLHPYRL